MLALKNLLFTAIVPGTVAVYVPLRLAQGAAAASGGLLALAIVLFFVGAALYAWCVWDFATFGRGTPLPVDAPTRLVVRGLYRYTRNPMYLGVLTVILSWATLYRSTALAVYAVVVGLCFHLFIILYEERHLRRVFGRDYAAYCTKVPRWIPRF